MEDPPSRPTVYRFGIFKLDSRTGEISSDGTKTQLREQPFQLLLALLEKPGELVTREDLVRRLWPEGTFVDFDRGLNKAILSLREALGDSAEKPKFVETLPRKGYRFIASVASDRQECSAVPTPPHPARASRSGYWIAALILLGALGVVVATNLGGVRDWLTNRWRPTSEITALAVIPLENLSRDPEQEYFADGMTDELITDLAKTATARMASRTSVMRYKGTKKSVRELGRELEVDAIVEGTVTRSGDRVRITAQLIQTATDMHLWAETYERDASEVLRLQHEVATDIASRISSVVKPLDQPRRVNPDAYGLYLKGRDFFYRYSDQGWQQAIEYFNRAIEVDPEFAPAYSGLADAYLVGGAYGVIPTQEALTHGKAAAAKALALDDKLASAHYALATAYTWYDWDWAGAEKEFQLGLALNLTMRSAATGMPVTYPCWAATTRPLTKKNGPANSISSHSFSRPTWPVLTIGRAATMKRSRRPGGLFNSIQDSVSRCFGWKVRFATKECSKKPLRCGRQWRRLNRQRS